MSEHLPLVSVGVLGAGTVGSQVIRLIGEHATDLSARSGARIEVTSVLVRSLDAQRDVEPEALALLVDEVAADESGNQAQYDPTDDTHGLPPFA